MAEVEISEELQKDLVKGIIESDEFIAANAKTAEDAATKAAEAVFAKFDTAAKKTVAADGDEADDAADAADAAKKGMINTDITRSVETALVKRYFGDNEALAKDFPLAVKSPYAQMSKEKRFFLGVKALINKDQETIKSLNAFAGELYAIKGFQDGRFSDMAEKAGYANDAVSADGGALVPDPEFNTTVYDNLPNYGVIFAEGNVQTTDHTAVYALSLTGTIQFTNVAEAGAISGTKLSFNRKLTNLIKYAAIVPATSELTEDSIVDYWQIVTNEVSRAYGLVADQQVFTDPTNGILHQTGILTEPIAGGPASTIAWDDLLNAEGSTEDSLDTSDFAWHMRKAVFFKLATTKTSGSGQYFQESLSTGWIPNPNNPTTPWGTPVKFTRVLPKTTEVGANGGLAVYGTLKNTNFYNKNGLAITMLTEATITDAASNSFNLATQDGMALRVVVRILHILPLGNASKFVVLGTGTVS
jgi:HK97 family phage major capsid protein